MLQRGVSQFLSLFLGKEIKIDTGTAGKLLTTRAATIDRLLREDKKKQQFRGISHTKPGTLLKHQIPIRTFSKLDL